MFYYPFKEVSQNEATPSHHPFLSMGFSMNQKFWGYPHDYGNLNRTGDRNGDLLLTKVVICG